MHRIDVPSATPEEQFTEGSPSGGVPATTVSADWLNDVQEELISILTAAGIAPVKGEQGQILQALTDLIQGEVGSFTGATSYSANTNLTEADIGKVIVAGLSATPLSWTTPNTAAVRVGDAIEISNNSSKVVTLVQQNAADRYLSIFDPSGTATSFAIPPGSEVTLVKYAANFWLVLGTGSVLRGPMFEALLAANGYQKIPSGRIEVQGTFTASATPGAPVPVTFVLPATNLRNLVLTPVSSGTTAVSAWFDSPTGAGFNGHCSVASAVVHYRAILD